ILRGRALTDDDRAGATEVVLVNEAMVRRFWPRGDPLGRQVRVNVADRWSTKTIVGIVRDTRSVGSRLNGDPEMFVPFAQNPTAIQRFVLTTAQPAEVIAPLAKAAVAAVDPALPAGAVESVEEITTTRAVAQWWFATTLMGIFALTSLVLAA